MGTKSKKLLTSAVLSGGLLLFGNLCLASENVVYIINNNNPHYQNSNNSSGGGYEYGNGVVCTRHGGICATGRYLISTSRTIYAPPQWKRPTIRERRLSEGKESIPYYQRQAYYQ